jgi:hypothetical protein
VIRDAHCTFNTDLLDVDVEVVLRSACPRIRDQRAVLGQSRVSFKSGMRRQWYDPVMAPIRIRAEKHTRRKDYRKTQGDQHCDADEEMPRRDSKPGPVSELDASHQTIAAVADSFQVPRRLWVVTEEAPQFSSRESAIGPDPKLTIEYLVTTPTPTDTPTVTRTPTPTKTATPTPTATASARSPRKRKPPTFAFWRWVIRFLRVFRWNTTPP